MMRISVLSRRSGVPVPTIKYYLRERLLPPGVSTAPNQARYGEAHLRRLRLIRTLTGVGRMELAAVRELLAAIDDDQVGLAEMYQLVNRTVCAEVPEAGDREILENTRRDVQHFLVARGWETGGRGEPGSDALVCALAALRELGCEGDLQLLRPMAEAAERLVVDELAARPAPATVNAKAVAVVRTVLFEAAFNALRHLAREHQVLTRLRQSASGFDVA